MPANQQSIVERAELRIPETLDLTTREQLIARIEYEPGVEQAQFHYPDPHRLEIIYDPSAIDPNALLTAITQQGLTPSIVGGFGDRVERVLVAIDQDGISEPALDYIGRIAAGHANLHLCLYCRLPALPPELREHQGSENEARERELGRELAARVEAWVAMKRAAVQPLLERARSTLECAGVPCEAIEIEISRDASRGESLAEALLRVARASGCHTIALARTHDNFIHDFAHRHTADSLLHKGAGFAFWVIE
jgi:hypothetical protein